MTEAERAQHRDLISRLVLAARDELRDEENTRLAEEWAEEEERRVFLKPRPVIVERWHGTLNGYSHHGCRCELCRKARSDSYFHYKAQGKTYR